MGYVATKSRPRYLDTDLKAEFAGDNPDYFDVKTNKWYSTSGGGELVANGTFTTNTTGWTSTNATLSIVNGTLKVTNNTVNGFARQDITTVAGRKFTVVATLTQNSAYARLEVYSSTGILLYNSGNYSGKINIEFVAQTAGSYIVLYAIGSVNGDNSYFDNISVFQSDLTIGSEITPRNYLNNIVYADHNGQPEYVEEVAKVEYKDIIKANEYIGKNACTAWCSIKSVNQTPPLIQNGSYNFSAVIRTSNGVLDVYFTNPMDNTNYTAVAVDGYSPDYVVSVGVKSLHKVQILGDLAQTANSPRDVDANIVVFGGKN